MLALLKAAVAEQVKCCYATHCAMLTVKHAVTLSCSSVFDILLLVLVVYTVIQCSGMLLHICACSMNCACPLTCTVYMMHVYVYVHCNNSF